MKKKMSLVITGGILAVLIIVLLTVAVMLRRTIRSDSPGVEFSYDGEIMTEVKISGRIPYGIVVSSKEEDTIRDGEAKEKATTYTIGTGFSLRRKNSLKIPIETLEGVTCTYILKFADKDVTITDGKVVEQ